MVTKRLDDERIAAESEALVIEPELPLPTLFSQTTILAFTIFFSPLFGGALLAMNVAAVKKAGVWQVLSLSINLYFCIIIDYERKTTANSLLFVLCYSIFTVANHC